MDIAGKKLEINKRVVPSVSERHTSIEPGKCRSYAPLPAPYAHATPGVGTLSAGGGRVPLMSVMEPLIIAID